VINTDLARSGSTEILTHPREIPSLVRRTDDTRALKRAAKAERKAAEKLAKEEEARRQKGEKRREMEKQMASLRKDLGFEDGDGKGEVDWDELEKVMEGDFDEGEWERVVGKMLGSREYNVSGMSIRREIDQMLNRIGGRRG
jgi:protein KRI1